MIAEISTRLRELRMDKGMRQEQVTALVCELAKTLTKKNEILARRLGPEVIGPAVDNNGPANDVFDAETIYHHHQIGRATAG